FLLCFFFSSRRRHTRFSRDWNSDVCSSDLPCASPRQSRSGRGCQRTGQLRRTGHDPPRRAGPGSPCRSPAGRQRLAAVHGQTPAQLAQAPVAGTLLAIFDLQRLTGALPQLPSDAGQVRLIQQFPSAPERILDHTGNSQGTEVRLNTASPHPEITFRDGEDTAAVAPIPPWLTGAIPQALAGALATLMYQLRIWARAVPADA